MTYSAPTPRTENLRLMLSRMVGAARLNGSIFRSLREDSAATGQSLLVLGITGLSFGLGFAFSLGGDIGTTLLGGLLGVVFSLVLGFVWVSLIFLIGTRLLRGNAGYWGLVRPVFFSTSPGLLFLFTLVPNVAVQEVFRALGIAWIAIASVFAVKHVFGFDSPRSFVTFIVASFILLIAYGLIVSI